MLKSPTPTLYLETRVVRVVCLPGYVKIVV